MMENKKHQSEIVFFGAAATVHPHPRLGAVGGRTARRCLVAVAVPELETLRTNALKRCIMRNYAKLNLIEIEQIIVYLPNKCK